MANKALIEELRRQIGTIESTSCDAAFNGTALDDKSAQSDAPSSFVQETSSPESAPKKTVATDNAVDATKDSEAAFKKIVALVNASDKSEHTLRSRLKECGFEEAAIEVALERAKEYSIVDDARYAEILIRSRIAQGRGMAGIERELRQQNIDPDSVVHVEEHGSDEELDRALAYLDRKPPRSKNLRDGAYRKLMQRGYASAIASSASRIWVERNAG